MLFNTFGFIFLFLPITLGGYFAFARRSQALAAGWLTVASLFFYGFWDFRFLPLLVGSILFNYLAGYRIADASAAGRKRTLATAVAANLLLLGYFKYANFFISSVASVTGFAQGPLNVVLPIGISFFTFTQIAYLVDTYQGKVKEYKFLHYALFVTYFPHLIAGPVLHHREMMPQFGHPQTYRPSGENFAVGLTIFVIGLAKKVLLADNLAPLANPVFVPHAQPAFVEAWIGVLAYTMQLYFDFSGYSDMAIGLSRLFGVRLPLNFNSPYKADSIIEFWRRWHMTLSRFLRDYLYIPLGGNRRGPWSRYRNLMLTMILGGLWHGAGWTFVVWGGLHGLYLVINHLWRIVPETLGWPSNSSRPFAVALNRGITFLAVVVAWVFFRAPDLTTAIEVLNGMLGINGVSFPGWARGSLGWLAGAMPGIRFDGLRSIDFGSIGPPMLLAATCVAMMTPNTQELLANQRPCLEPVVPCRTPSLTWKTSVGWAVFVSGTFVLCILSLTRVTEFLYFQF